MDLEKYGEDRPAWPDEVIHFVDGYPCIGDQLTDLHEGSVCERGCYMADLHSDEMEELLRVEYVFVGRQ